MANAAQVAEHERQGAEHEASRQGKLRYDKFNYRRSELRARHGYDPAAMMPGQLKRIDERVDATLAREFPDLFAGEQEQQKEAKRAQIRESLAPGEDPTTMSGERRQETEEAIDSWLESDTTTV